MSKESQLFAALETLKKSSLHTDSITKIQHIPVKKGEYREYPEEIHPALVKVLQDKGFSKLYTHQLKSWQLRYTHCLGKNALLQFARSRLHFEESLFKSHIPFSDKSSRPGPEG